ncbi:MAG: hypothetical protein AAF823_10675 [Planctomycetota bacterium]
MTRSTTLDRTTAVCYALIASATVLSGLLIFGLDQRWGRHHEAQAALVIARDNFTILTTPTRSSEEALLVLDNASGRLLVYRLDVTRKSLTPVAGYEVPRIFERSIQN